MQNNKKTRIIPAVIIITVIMLGFNLSACGKQKQEILVGETDKGTPIIEFEDHDLVWENTYDSTCFSKIGYDEIDCIVGVVFRDSGAEYIYEGVPKSVWLSFRNASSLGSYYNKNIKGKYPCRKISD